jgi:hypothetical protein
MGGEAFVGRREERATLDRAVAEARSGRARTVLLAGEPGVGKTAIATEIVRGLADARVAFCRAWEGAGPPAFWLWRECFRDLGEDLALPRAIVTEEARFTALESIVTRVRASSRDSLLVAVLDDLQWADLPSLFALKLLVRSLRSERLCVLATIREPADVAPEVASVIADIRREATVLTMGGLGRGDLAELARARGLESEAAALVLERATGGNALFAVELLADRDARTALEDGRLGVPLPRGVRNLLDRHLARLGDGERDVVDWAAVCGEPIDLAAVAGAAGLPPARAFAAIDIACREGVLVRAGDSLRFAHALLRSAAYEGVPHERRARMHEALGRVLAERDPAGAACIRHLFAADPASSNAEVARGAMEAARAALGRMSYEDAGELARKAADVFERGGRRADLAIALSRVAEARVLGGDAEGSTADAERALVVARESGDAVALAHAALAVGQRRTMGTSSRPLAAALEAALSRLDAERNLDPALRCAVEARLAAALQPNIDPQRAVETGRRAIARARETGDPEIVARTIHAARPAFRLLEPADERAAMDLELLALSERLGDEPLAAHALGRVFWGAIEAGDETLADSTLASFERLAERLRLPHHELLARAARSVREAMQGHFEAAERLIQQIETTRERWRPALAAALPIDPALMLRVCLAAARGEPFVFSLPPDLPAEAPRDVLAMMKLFFDARAGHASEAAAAFGAVAPRILGPGCPYMVRAFSAMPAGGSG